MESSVIHSTQISNCLEHCSNRIRRVLTQIVVGLGFLACRYWSGNRNWGDWTQQHTNQTFGNKLITITLASWGNDVWEKNKKAEDFAAKVESSCWTGPTALDSKQPVTGLCSQGWEFILGLTSNSSRFQRPTFKVHILQNHGLISSTIGIKDSKHP